MSQEWVPSLGAWPEADGVRFRVWAPDAASVDVVFDAPREPVSLRKSPDGTFGAFAAGLQAGDRYRYRIDKGHSFPDPASRFQPEGVHGPSAVVAPRRFAWTDSTWTGVARDDLVLYELHIGTFTPSGTFAEAATRLTYLARLGVTAVELMPVADFPGTRNWGYDGVDLFAPARCYGTPDDLRRFVDAAHREGLAVFLDVVYNHLGPEGNYLSAYSPYYFTERHRTPWGQGLNFDGPNNSMVREFFIENALHWVHEYHIDGLRLDATHAIADDSERHFIEELAARVHASPRRAYVVAEDDRNLAVMIRDRSEGGWGLDGLWADDFHHKVRVALTGEREGYYRDYTGAMPLLARTLNQGWYYTGQYSAYHGQPRGTDPSGIPPQRFVFCIQNHDQVGNRAFGERLHHLIALSAYRAATVLLLCAPATPLLFMGQEWAAATPFLYFTDHPDALGKLVTEGRRNEFRHFSAFSDPEVRSRIPDPQAEATFAASRLDWTEKMRDPHASTLLLYERLLQLRRQETAIRGGRFNAYALTDSTLLLRQDAETGPSLIIVVHMQGSTDVRLTGREAFLARLDVARSQLILTSEDPSFAPDPHPPTVTHAADGLTIAFVRPSAIVLKIASRGPAGDRAQTTSLHA